MNISGSNKSEAIPNETSNANSAANLQPAPSPINDGTKRKGSNPESDTKKQRLEGEQ